MVKLIISEVNSKYVLMSFCSILIVTGVVILSTVPSSYAGPPTVPGTFTEWNTLGQDPGTPNVVSDFDPHITTLEKTGATGFDINTPWYTIDNRSPSPPCAIGHLSTDNDVRCSWGFGSGLPVGIANDGENGRIWHTVTGSFSAVAGGPSVSTVHIAYMTPTGAETLGLTLPPNGDAFTHFPSTGPGAGITLDSSQNAYYAEVGGSFGGAGDKVTKIVPGSPSTYTRWLDPVGSVSFNEPRYLCFNTGDDTNLYFTSSSFRRIHELNVATGHLKTWQMPGAGVGSTSVLESWGIFCESSGSIWYADTGGDRIGNLDPTTNTIKIYEKGMNGPSFLSVSSDDQLFFTEKLNSGPEGTDHVSILDTTGSATSSSVVVPAETDIVPTTHPDNTPIVFDRDRRCEQITPVVTMVDGVDPPSIVRFPVPPGSNEPVGMTEVVTTLVGNTLKSGIFGDHFSSNEVFLFESSIIIPPPPVLIGGTILPLDTMSLALAGIQTSASWMIPVVVAGIGIGLVVLRKFRN